MKRDPLYSTYLKLYKRLEFYKKKRSLADAKGRVDDYKLYSILISKTEYDIKFLDQHFKNYKEV